MPVQRGDFDTLGGGQFMVDGADQDHATMGERMDIQERMARLCDRQAEIGPSADQPVLDLVDRSQLQFQIQFRTVPGEIGENMRQDAEADRGRRDDAQPADDPAAQFVDDRIDALLLHEEVLRLFGDPPRLGRRHETSVFAHKKLHAGQILGMADHVADGGLRDAELFGGPGRRADLDDGAQNFELAGVDQGITLCYSLEAILYFKLIIGGRRSKAKPGCGGSE